EIRGEHEGVRDERVGREERRVVEQLEIHGAVYGCRSMKEIRPDLHPDLGRTTIDVDRGPVVLIGGRFHIEALELSVVLVVGAHHGNVPLNGQSFLWRARTM